VGRCGVTCDQPSFNGKTGVVGSVSVDLGGTVVEISSESDSWLRLVRDRYGAFVSTGRPTMSIVHSEDEHAMITRHGFLTVVDPEGRRAQIAERRRTEILDGVLRIMLPRVIAPDLALHGALLADGDRGFLCCGVSGSGKSTMAAMFPKVALCDELVRVHAGFEGVEARSLPFWVARPGTVDLCAVFILEHGTENRRTPVDSAEAVRIMMRHVNWPVGTEEALSRCFETLVALCRRVPIFRLEFVPDRGVWETMTEFF